MAIEQLRDLRQPALAPPMGSEAKQALDRLHTVNLSVVRGLGLGANFEQQLVAKSRQSHIRATTPNDTFRRFATHDSYLAWRHAQPLRQIYALHDDDDLAGIVWFSPSSDSDVPSPDIAARTTFAIRLYADYTGLGLALPFMQASHGTAGQPWMLCWSRAFGYRLIATTRQL